MDEWILWKPRSSIFKLGRMGSSTVKTVASVFWCCWCSCPYLSKLLSQNTFGLIYELIESVYNYLHTFVV